MYVCTASTPISTILFLKFVCYTFMTKLRFMCPISNNKKNYSLLANNIENMNGVIF